MRLHIENQTNRIEELERDQGKLEKKFDEELVEIRQEKRRLNDLLTIREDEI